MEVAFGASPSRRVTRLRADLAVEHLDSDLVLEADDVQSELGPTYRVRAYTNEYSACPYGVAYTMSHVLPPSAPGSISGARASCAVPTTSSSAVLPLGFFTILAGIGWMRRRASR